MVKKKYPYQELELTNLHGEYWESIPYLDGAYEISSYGRVKSLQRWIERPHGRGFWTRNRIIKTRVHKQELKTNKRKNYRLAATISFDGKKHSVAIARLVYYLFVKKFDLEDRTLVVSPKDEDPFNIRPDNLTLVSPAVNIIKAYKKGRRPLECFENKASEVSQYDLNGNHLNTFPSISAAASVTGISSGQIAKAINERNRYSAGYIWYYGKGKKKLAKIPVYVTKKKASNRLHSTVITQYDLEGRKISEYPNIKAAAKAVKSQSSQMRYVILGKSFTAKGYFWKLGAGPEKIDPSPIIKLQNSRKKKICRPITQYDLNGQRIGFYESLAEAARMLNVSLISMGNDDEIVKCYGYLWKYGKGPATIKVPEKIKHLNNLKQFYNQPVTQYNLDGKRVAEYETVIEAAEKIKSQVHTLVGALTGKYLSCKGYYWRTGKGAAHINVGLIEKPKQERLKKISKPVVQFDLSGRKIRSYASIGEASRATGVSHSQIAKVAGGIYKAAKGFVWKYDGYKKKQIN